MRSKQNYERDSETARGEQNMHALYPISRCPRVL